MNVGIDNYMDALDMAKYFAYMRELYNNMLSIAENEYLEDAVRYEAREITEDGFMTFVHCLNKLGGNV